MPENTTIVNGKDEKIQVVEVELRRLTKIK